MNFAMRKYDGVGMKNEAWQIATGVVVILL